MDKLNYGLYDLVCDFSGLNAEGVTVRSDLQYVILNLKCLTLFNWTGFCGHCELITSDERREPKSRYNEMLLAHVSPAALTGC